MLYLEDYLEMIEHLPQELRDRFTEMRELDLTVQNNMDELEKRVKLFFNDCKRYPTGEIPLNVKVEFDSIGKEYKKTMEDADEKVHLANQMYDLVDKYLRRLDTELHKFKCELEADSKGITEILEKRSLEMDNPSAAVNNPSQQKENRYERTETHNIKSRFDSYSGPSTPQQKVSRPNLKRRRSRDSPNPPISSNSSSSFRYSRQRSEKRRESSNSLNSSFAEKRQAVAPLPLVETRHAAVSQPAPSVQSTVSSYNLGHIGAGPAIAAAASQAIAATQQMQQGRRTASLKASYEAINTGSHGGHDFIGRELTGAAQIAIQAIQQDHANNKKKSQKKWSSSGGGSSNSNSSSATSTVQAILNAPIAAPAPESPSIDVSSQAAEVTDGEWSYDPNEPRYCLCNQVSYGDMVACDNEDCPTEWFHYPCVGITAPPKGKWYCPQCTASMKRKRRN